jgi:ribosomal protein S12 methylthiotransferase
VPERVTGVRDLLELPRATPAAPWAYVKIAEGCDRACTFCAIPSFRGRQRSRRPEAIEAEVRALVEEGVAEIVLVAQDLAWYGRDAGEPGALAPLLRRLDSLAPDGLARVRLLYLYPSEVRDPLVGTMLELDTVVPYFDLSLQHSDRALLRAMKRWGSGDRFIRTIDAIRAAEPDAAFRSSFIVGFPGETESEHDHLLEFLDEAKLDWAGFFAFSRENGTPAATMPGAAPERLVGEWLRECEDVQEAITRAARDALVGSEVEVLVDGHDDETGVLVGRTHREAPEIDGVVHLDAEWARPGAVVRAHVTDAIGTDLAAKGVST